MNVLALRVLVQCFLQHRVSPVICVLKPELVFPSCACVTLAADSAVFSPVVRWLDNSEDYITLEMWPQVLCCLPPLLFFLSLLIFHLPHFTLDGGSTWLRSLLLILYLFSVGFDMKVKYSSPSNILLTDDCGYSVNTLPCTTPSPKEKDWITNRNITRTDASVPSRCQNSQNTSRYSFFFFFLSTTLYVPNNTDLSLQDGCCRCIRPPVVTYSVQPFTWVYSCCFLYEQIDFMCWSKWDLLFWFLPWYRNGYQESWKFCGIEIEF